MLIAQNLHNPKNEDNLKNGDNPQNEDNCKNDDNPKMYTKMRMNPINEDKWNPRIKMTQN